MPEDETRRLKLIPFSLELKRMAVADKSRLADLLGVRIPDSWPGQGMEQALPFFISEMEKRPAEPAPGRLIVHKDDNILIGDMDFKCPQEPDGHVEIGYSIIPEYRNQGYATEMVCHLISEACQQPGVTSVTAECLDDNPNSLRVLEKAGLRHISSRDHTPRWGTSREE